MSEIKENTIGKDFTLKELIKFVAGPVLARFLVSILQTLDDSLFLSRYCGENALAAFSMAMPWFMIVDGFGMLTSSVSSYCSIKLGEKKNKEANSDFTTMSLITLGIGCCLTLVLVFFLEPILRLLGETDVLMPYAKTYMSVSRYYIPLLLISYTFSRFYVVAGKPKHAMYSNILNTFANFFFDYLFIAKLQLGIIGAAYTNLIGNLIVFVFGLIFYCNPKQEIHFVKPASKPLDLLKNVFKLGRPSLITSLSLSANSYIANSVLMKVGAELLVSAYTIVNNVQFMFMNVFFSLIGTTMPLVSYAYGERNAKKLAKNLKQIFTLVTMTIVIIILVFILGKNFIISLYITAKSNPSLKDLVEFGFKVAPLGFLFFGYNVLVQECATSMSNPKVSTSLSIIQNVLFANLFMLILPMILGSKIIWFVFSISEFCTFIFSLTVIFKYKDVYGYGRNQIATFVNETRVQD